MLLLVLQVVATATVLYVLYKFIVAQITSTKVKGMPGYTYISPVLLALTRPHLHPFMNPRGMEERIKDAEAQGHKTFRLTLGDKNFVFTTDTKIAKEIYITKTKQFMRDSTFRENSFSPALNVFSAAGGEEWKRHRMLLNPAFSDTNLKVLFETTFDDMTKRLVGKWNEEITKHGSNEAEVAVVEDTGALTLDVIGKAGFNKEILAMKDEKGTVPKIVAELFEKFILFTLIPKWIYMTLPFPLFKRMKHTVLTWRKFLEEVIQDAKNLQKNQEEGVNNNNVVNMMLGAREEGVSALTEEELISNSNAFMAAGHETTTITLSWALYYLAKQPEYQNKLLQEVNSNVENKDQLISFEQMDTGFPLFKAVVKEVLRLHPPAYVITREATEDTTIGEDRYKISKGTHVGTCNLLMNMDKTVFGEDAQEFRPERFYEAESKHASELRYLFTAFGIGPRQCIGKKFAEFEAVLALIRLVQNFEFSLAKGYENIGERVAFTLKPDRPLKIVAKRRN